MKNCTFFDVREHGMREMILGATVASLLITPAWADGTGADPSNSAVVREWCVQESTRGEVWQTKLSLKAAIQAAYRACRPEFTVLLSNLSTIAKRQQFHAHVVVDHAERVEFAVEMKKLGNPDDQQF